MSAIIEKEAGTGYRLRKSSSVCVFCIQFPHTIFHLAPNFHSYVKIE